MNIQGGISRLSECVQTAQNLKQKTQIITSFIDYVDDRFYTIAGIDTLKERGRWTSNIFATYDELCFFAIRKSTKLVVYLGLCDPTLRVKTESELTSDMLATLEFGRYGVEIISDYNPLYDRNKEYVPIRLTWEQAISYIVTHIAIQISGVAQMHKGKVRREIIGLIDSWVPPA